MRGSTVKRGRTWSYVLYLGRDTTGRKRQKRSEERIVTVYEPDPDLWSSDYRWRR